MLKDFLNKEGKKSTKLCSLNLFKKKFSSKNKKKIFIEVTFTNEHAREKGLKNSEKVSKLLPFVFISV